jgi:hypothetical protein
MWNSNSVIAWLDHAQRDRHRVHPPSDRRTCAGMARRARDGAATGSGDAARASPGADERTLSRWPAQWADRAQAPCTCRRPAPDARERRGRSPRSRRAFRPAPRPAAPSRDACARRPARRRSRLNGVGGGVAAHRGQGAEGGAARPRSCFPCNSGAPALISRARGALLLSCTQASVADFGRQVLASDDEQERGSGLPLPNETNAVSGTLPDPRLTAPRTEAVGKGLRGAT